MMFATAFATVGKGRELNNYKLRLVNVVNAKIDNKLSYNPSKYNDFIRYNLISTKNRKQLEMNNCDLVQYG